MNPIQKKLLELADTIDLGQATNYSISKKLEVNHPYKVKYAIEQLIKKGFLTRNPHTGSIVRSTRNEHIEGLISIPYYGEVNCGEALAFADDTVKSYLKVSPSILSTTNFSNLFALKAVGRSMNDASIGGKPANDGDYVIAQKVNPALIKNGEYVISLIGGAANLKQFYKDDAHQRVLLLSKSTDDYPPIVISQHDVDDLSSYQLVAKAVDVIPGVRL